MTSKVAVWQAHCDGLSWRSAEPAQAQPRHSYSARLPRATGADWSSLERRAIQCNMPESIQTTLESYERKC